MESRALPLPGGGSWEKPPGDAQRRVSRLPGTSPLLPGYTRVHSMPTGSPGSRRLDLPFGWGPRLFTMGAQSWEGACPAEVLSGRVEREM